MKKNKFLVGLFSTFIFIAFAQKVNAQTITCTTSAITYTSQSCQCVQYVKRRLGYNDGTVAADSWGPKLICKGFTSLNNQSIIPTNKDIIIFDHTYGHGIDATYGHVALVVSATETSDHKSFVVTFVNTNWGSGTTSTECGCTNVTTNSLTIEKTAFGSTVFLYRNASMIKSCS